MFPLGRGPFVSGMDQHFCTSELWGRPFYRSPYVPSATDRELKREIFLQVLEGEVPPGRATSDVPLTRP